MKWFNDLRLATKLALAFASVIVLTSILGIFSMLQLASVNANVREITTNWMPATQKILEVKASQAEHRANTLLHILSTDAAEMARFEQIRDEIMAELKKSQEGYVKLIASPEEQAMYDEFVKQFGVYLTVDAKVLTLSRENKNEEAKALMRGESAQLDKKVDDIIDKLVEMNVNGSAAAEKASETLYERARTLIIGLLAVTLVFAIGAAFLTTRWLMRQLGGEPNYAADIAGKIAAGDLAVTVDVKPGDSSSLLFAMNTMRESLARIVSEVRTGTDTIATASNQIATGNLDLSSRTEEQASSLEETASSMEELTSTVRQNADNAVQANQLVQTAASVAMKGGEVVAQVVDTMGAINDSAKKIVDIIAVIDGIAFQTNILALNAAVEAARAGEQGRGFAVVASEVRNLAQRSAAAAKEIKTLIGDSVEKVDLGAKLVDQAGATMEEIVSSVKRVTDIMNEITAASREQASGIGQVNDTVTQMDQITQQNAALVEEAAAAAQSLQDQSANLAQVVSVFRLDGMYAAASGGAATAPGMHAHEAKVLSYPRAAKRHPPPPAVPHQSKKIVNTGGEWEQF